jgi:hypothetical protein
LRYIEPLLAAVLLLFARFRLGALARRRRRWKEEGREAVKTELKAIQEAVARMPDDPSAEQAAEVLRRRCPDVISEIAFDGTYFRAFTYMDFLFYPKL